MPTKTGSMLDALVAKFTGALDHQDQLLVERRKALQMFQVSLVGRLHTVYHGNPGNAKSMTVDGMLQHFPDLRLFKTQAYKASTPEQFLGPISMKGLENDEYRRITTGKFADCDVAFVDETPRAPKPVLTAFQGGMVEREFDNGDGPKSIPLMSFIGTSNHLPDDEELQAFFDRFTFKLVIAPPQAQESIVAILRGGVARRNGASAAIPADLLISKSELEAMQHEATLVNVPDDILEMQAELYSNLVGIGITPSIRRLNDLILGYQAFAVLQGRREVVQDDILLAADSLWTAESEIEAVYAEVVKFASEWAREAADLQASYDEARDKLTSLQSKVAQLGQAPVSRDMTNDGIDIVSANERLRPLVEKHIGAAAGRDVAPLQRVLDEMAAAKGYVESRLLGGLSL